MLKKSTLNHHISLGRYTEPTKKIDIMVFLVNLVSSSSVKFRINIPLFEEIYVKNFKRKIICRQFKILEDKNNQY